MIGVVASSPGKIGAAERAEPSLLPGTLRIRSACSLISPGTELHYLHGAAEGAYPLALGYCSSGIVEAVGEGVQGFEADDRVIAMGWGHAVHAETIVVPYKLCVKLPDGLPFEQAVFANIGATSLHAVHRATLQGRERVLVVGAGLVGQLVMQWARTRVKQVYAADLSAKRLEIAGRAGKIRCLAPLKADALLSELEAGGISFDTVFLCASGDATELLAACVRLMARYRDGHRRGTIVVVGRFEARVQLNVDMGNVDIRYSARCGAGYRDDDYVHGRTSYEAPEGEATVDCNLAANVKSIQDGSLSVSSLLTHRFPVRDAAQAYEVLRNPDEALGVTFFY